MTTYVALLRAINLVARNRVSMPDLRTALAEAGHAGVRTYVQSGNVVLESDAAAADLERDLRALVAERFGVDTPVVVRTAAELARVVERNPFAEIADDPKRHQVTFLSAPPADDVVRDLLAADLAPERVAVDGREIHAWHPQGIQRSPLANRLTDKRLGVTATARNWRTVLALHELAGAAEERPGSARVDG